jgi:hypothetical protein
MARQDQPNADQPSEVAEAAEETEHRLSLAALVWWI